MTKLRLILVAQEQELIGAGVARAMVHC